MELSHALFGTKNALDWAQECARAALVFAYGLVLVRVAGRRIFARWSAPDIVVAIVVGSNLSRALTGNAALWGTLAGTSLLVLLHWLVSQAAARWPRVSHVIEGTAVRIGSGGDLIGGALRRHSLSDADIREALRQSGVESPEETRLLILEPSGKISVLK